MPVEFSSKTDLQSADEQGQELRGSRPVTCPLAPTRSVHDRRRYSYSSTEKKRIRKSFAKRASVLNVPFLLATQLESYTAFLQAAVPPEKRKNEGLQAAFTSIFPI